MAALRLPRAFTLMVVGQPTRDVPRWGRTAGIEIDGWSVARMLVAGASPRQSVLGHQRWRRITMYHPTTLAVLAETRASLYWARRARHRSFTVGDLATSLTSTV